MIQLFNPKLQYLSIKREIDKVVSEVIKSGNFILGENVEKFEQEFANYLNINYAISCASGTDALTLALRAIDIKPNDEVITTSHTFVATAEAILNSGAKPVFVDIDEKTYNINPDLIEEKITKRTKAILVVHIYGQPANMSKIRSIAKKYKLKVIEDCAQAAGAEYKGKKVGTLSDIGCFSFYPTKNLSCYGDGGCCVTNNKEYATKLKMLRTHGAKVKNYSEIIGYNSRLDELQAAILRVKLKYLDAWNNIRRDKVHYYNIFLQDLYPNVIIPYEEKYSKHIYHLYVIRVKNREKLIDYLKGNDIQTGVYYPLPIHLQKAYRNFRVKLEITEQVAASNLALPLYPELKEKYIRRICELIKRFYL